MRVPQIGYRRRPGHYGGKPFLAVDNTLDRQFDVDAPYRAWATDITRIRTLEGFACLAVVIDLYSRRVVGQSVQVRQTTDVALQALRMAVWRRKPKGKVLVRSDRGFQFTSMSMAWAAFLKDHNLEHSMSRRGNCHDNTAAGSIFKPAQAGADTASDIQNSRRGASGCVRLHRDVLQSQTQARHERDAVARRF